MVTQLGKVLDPMADKLTQAAVSIALCIRHPELIILTVIFVIKAVSYTHLDVYKRQRLCHAAKSGSAPFPGSVEGG